MRYKINYSEGDWFAIPLEKGGWAVGLIARGPRRLLLGYFFGPRRHTLPSIADILDLRPENAILVCQFGDLGLVTNRWSILGKQADWNRADWPLPPFGHIDFVDPTKAYLRIYDERDLSQLPREVATSPENARRYPEDGLAGEGAVVAELDHFLSMQP